MRRPLAAIVLAFAAAPLFAITGSPVRVNRIGVPRMAQQYDDGPENAVAATVQRELQSELRARGFDVVDTGMTFADLRRSADDGTPLYVEIVGGEASEHTRGEVGIGSAEGIAGTIGIVVSRVAAEVRVYDGRTLALQQSSALAPHSTAVAPTGIGTGGRWSWLWVGLPSRAWSGYRSAAHDVARYAADRIAEVARR